MLFSRGQSSFVRALTEGGATHVHVTQMDAGLHKQCNHWSAYLGDAVEVAFRRMLDEAWGECTGESHHITP